MEIEVLDIGIEINVTPLEEICIEPTYVHVIFDDVNEKRWKISFSPYQGFKITAIDCINVSTLLVNGKRPYSLLEVKNSSWIKELNNVLQQKDHTANFLDKSAHYILPFQDIIVEIVAWNNFKIEPVN